MEDSEIRPFNFKFERITMDQWKEFYKLDPTGVCPAGPIDFRVADHENNMQFMPLGGRNSSSLSDPEFMPSYYSFVWNNRVVRFAVFLASKVIDDSYKNSVCKVWRSLVCGGTRIPTGSRMRVSSTA